MAQGIDVRIDVAVAAMAGVGGVTTLGTSGCRYDSGMAVTGGQDLHISGVVAMLTSVVSIPADLGTSRCLGIMMHQAVARGFDHCGLKMVTALTIVPLFAVFGAGGVGDNIPIAVVMSSGDNIGLEYIATDGTGLARIAIFCAGGRHHHCVTITVRATQYTDLVQGIKNFITVALIMARCIGQIEIRVRNTNPSPLVLCALVKNMPQVAIVERIIANTGHALRNRDAGQTTATFERIITNPGYTVRDDDASQTTATVECIVANPGHTAQDCDVRQPAATAERRITNPGHTVRDDDTGQTTATAERIIANAGHTVRDDDAGQAAAIIERIITNPGYTVRDDDAGQTTATVERIITNLGHTVRDDDASQTTATVECIVANPGHTVRDNDAGQTTAAVERIIANAGHIVRNGDAG